jgi:hypothetical protein
MLDRSHAILSTLEGQCLSGIYHVNRLKIAWIRTDNGPTNNYKDLQQQAKTKVKTADPVITDESGKQKEQALMYCKISSTHEPQNLDHYVQNTTASQTLAAPYRLNDKQKASLKETAKTREDGFYNVTKARVKEGDLQLLINFGNPDTQATWINTSQHPHLADFCKVLIHDSKFPVTGSKLKYAKSLLGLHKV